MIHVILPCFGTHGDVFPFVAFGRVLRARGNRVTLASNEQYRGLAAELEFEFAPLVSASETHEFMADPDLWHPIKCGMVAARWGVRYLRRQYDMLVGLAGDSDCVLAASPGVIAARLIQEKFARPMASVYYTPGIIASCTAPPAMTGGFTLPRWAPRPIGQLYWRAIDYVGSRLVGAELNSLRQSIGLEPVQRLFQWWISPDLAICLFPEWYAEPQPDWPPQMKVTDFPVFDGLANDAIDPRVLEYCRAGDPPVVFTFGTGMMHAAELFRESVAACRKLGARGILLSRFREHLPNELPQSVRHFDFVPLKQLLPLCSAIVHHGGIGTVARALGTGTPQLIIPLAWDQLDNAHRVMKLGAGTLLKRRKATSGRIATAMSGLRDGAVTSRCREIAARFVDSDGIDVAAQWVEDLNVTADCKRP